MIGHGLLTWGIYFHTILLPAPTQLSLYISFMLFMTGMSLFIPPLCQCVVIFISTLFIFTIPTCINPPPTTSLSQLGNVWWDGDDALWPIGWSDSVTADINTTHPDWMDISFHLLTEKYLGAGGGGVYVLDPFVIGSTNVWVPPRKPLLRTIFFNN